MTKTPDHPPKPPKSKPPKSKPPKSPERPQDDAQPPYTPGGVPPPPGQIPHSTEEGEAPPSTLPPKRAP